MTSTHNSSNFTETVRFRRSTSRMRNFILSVLIGLPLLAAGLSGASPYTNEIADEVRKLQSTSASTRMRAAEALGFLRAHASASALVSSLKDASPEVRVQAALALGWCGRREHVPELLALLDDPDWMVRQAAWVALTNLTGMEWPFDALAIPRDREAQANTWKQWWDTVPTEHAAPSDALALAVTPMGDPQSNDSVFWQRERGMRALGALGGTGAAEAVIAGIELYWRQTNLVGNAEAKVVQAGVRSLGQLRHPPGFPVLVRFLQHPRWARYAAEALADYGDERAVAPLLAAFPHFSARIDGRRPPLTPLDDQPGFEIVDRMYETPYEIAAALSRLPIIRVQDIEVLREIAHLLLVNLPSDFDGAMLYESEAAQRVTRHLFEVAGLRDSACAEAFAALGLPVSMPDVPQTSMFKRLAARQHGGIPHAAVWLPALCEGKSDTPQLLQLLEHTNGWVRINAVKALMFQRQTSAIPHIARILCTSKPEAAHGYFTGYLFDTKAQGQDEYDDPPPRWREAFVRALGRLGATNHIRQLTALLWDDRNVLEVQYAAAKALDELGTSESISVLARVEAEHPFYSIRLVARETLEKRNGGRKISPVKPAPGKKQRSSGTWTKIPDSSPDQNTIVFIKGPNRMPNRFQIDPWRQTYSTTDSGPTYRLGWNLFLLEPNAPQTVKPLTHFSEGYVADCEVSWDGQKVIFGHRSGADPWWHIWEINVDGSGLRQITHGPYHDVQPNYLPDDRIVFSTTRIGLRDEYHGYPATGLAIMSGDGDDIRCIGFNLGRDNEPTLMPDGRIVFSRLDLFYSRLKTELTVQAVFPDGTKNVTLYGPERRDLWNQINRQSGEMWWAENPPRHRVLRLTQPQPVGEQILCATTGGLTLLGPGREREEFVPHDRNFAVTTPFPLNDQRILCAAVDKRESSQEGNLKLYELELFDGEMKLLYHDPAAASFEPRPIRSRPRPPMTAESSVTPPPYTAQFLCDSVKNTKIPGVQIRGKLLRVVEGMPVVSRHYTHRNTTGEAWKNHVGTHAAVLGTIPLAADGSFFIEVPADRLLHMQVLDSDRRVVGNQQIWMYARPGERRGCVGCHEQPDTAPPFVSQNVAKALSMKPVPLLPTGGEFTYRAKAWQKGRLADETEEQTRTVRAVSLMGRR
jgi:HEAT repeat protein